MSFPAELYSHKSQKRGWTWPRVPRNFQPPSDIDNLCRIDGISLSLFLSLTSAYGQRRPSVKGLRLIHVSQDSLARISLGVCA